MPYVLPPLASQSAGLAVGEGGVWTADIAVSHMDPTDGALEGTLEGIQQRGQLGAMVVTTGLDDVWVASSSGLFRIDPADDEVLDVRRFTDVGQGQSIATSVAAGRAAIWVTKAGGTLFRISPTPGLPIEDTISLGDLPSDIAIAEGGVWITDEFGDLIRVDERTGETDAFQIGGTLTALAAAEHRLWIVDSDGLVVLFDLHTRRVLQSIPVGGTPVDVAVGSGVVWIADQRGERLVKIDETSREREAFALAAPPAAVAIDQDRGVIWVRTASSRSPNE
jgi:streptogramin lyase